MKHYSSAVGIRGDCLYCPLPLSIDSYWNCLTDCHHCYLRRLNRTWGQDLRPADPDRVRHQLDKGLSNSNPKSSLGWALKRKKTLRLGNKTDPYQLAECEYQVTRRIIEHLNQLDWSFVIQTRFTGVLQRDEDLLTESASKGLLTIMPVISPGAESDWELLERGRTTPVEERLGSLKRWVSKGWNVGVNGEPFIPGYHTLDQFRDILRRLKSVGVRSYNTYNLHFNDHVAKRFVDLGLDVERIWEHNQDKLWRPIQRQLCAIADEEGMILGCPDFVNLDPNWVQRSNTCCGVMVPNPSKFNTHWWRHLVQKGKSKQQILQSTWEGIGDYELGKQVLMGEPGCEFFTLRDAGL